MIHDILYFRGLDKKQAVLLTHGDSVEKVAENFKCIANSSTTIAGIANEKAHIYGLQFHPEVELSFFTYYCLCVINLILFLIYFDMQLRLIYRSILQQTENLL